MNPSVDGIQRDEIMIHLVQVQALQIRHFTGNVNREDLTRAPYSRL
jgi:hypothetical protein